MTETVKLPRMLCDFICNTFDVCPENDEDMIKTCSDCITHELTNQFNIKCTPIDEVDCFFENDSTVIEVSTDQPEELLLLTLRA